MWKRCRRWSGLVVVIAMVAVGCSAPPEPPLPQTYPVSGTVTYKGGEAVPTGTISFRQAGGADSLLLINGEIDDGTFTLSTQRATGSFQRVDGAPEGAYQVTIIPTSGQEHGIQSVTWPTPVKIAAKENELKFAIEKPKKR